MLMIETLHYLKDPKTMEAYGIFVILGNAGI